MTFNNDKDRKFNNLTYKSLRYNNQVNFVTFSVALCCHNSYDKYNKIISLTFLQLIEKIIASL